MVGSILDGRDAGNAWRELVARARPILCHTLRCFGRRRSGTLWEPDDLVQELYLHLSRAEWRRLRCYQARPGIRFASWLAAVAYDLLLQRHRAHCPQMVALDEEGHGIAARGHGCVAGETPEESCVRRETAVAVQQAIARLRHKTCQELIRRHCYLGETIADVAAEMLLTPPAARQMFKRNRDELRELLPPELITGR